MTIADRIAELREYARADGERCNDNSIADFLAFPVGITGMAGPYFLTEEGGNIRALWINDRLRLGVDFYGEGRARLVAIFLYPGRKKKAESETIYFDLAGLPNELTPESFLAFVKDHVYEEANESQPETNQHAIC